ncbi:MAG: VWA domain-containing protein [Candidatus Heimdallarchaeota archaeon]|nr:VWA domain-containing protein [Candidatus Heimdallarchaeota archaeon]
MIRVYRITLLTIVLMSIIFLNADIKQASGQAGMEPISLDIGGEINDNFANITYSLVFDNQASESDTLMQFDMNSPSPLLLSNVSASMGNDVYWGKVYPINQAQQIFNDSISANMSAVLVTYFDEVYTFEINVKAGILLYLDAYFEGYITRVRGAYELNIYEPIQSYILDFSIELDIISSFSTLLSNRLTGLGATYAKSSIANGIRLSYTSTAYSLSDSIHAIYSLNGLNAGGKLITSNNGTDSFFAYLFAPEIYDIYDREVREYLFVIDVSGSMSGNPLDQAKEAFKAMIDTLDGDDQFNVVAFAASSKPLWTESDTASDSNKNSAKSWVNDLSAGGGTNINDALIDGFGTFSGTSTAKAVAFLSDGAPTAGETTTSNILNNVKIANVEDIPIFSIAFGEGTDEGLMGSLAFETNGLFTKILPGDQAIQKLELFYENFAVPVALGVSMGYKGAIDIQPNPTSLIGALFNGTEIMSTGRYDGTLEITTKILYSDGDMTYINSAGATSANNPHVELIWAHNSINKLLLQVIADPSNQAKIDQIVNIAVEYGIVVPNYTGLTIVIENEPKAPNLTDTEVDAGEVKYDATTYTSATPNAAAPQDTRVYNDSADDAAPFSLFSVFVAISFVAILIRTNLRNK